MSDPVHPGPSLVALTPDIYLEEVTPQAPAPDPEACWFEGTAFQSKPGFRVEAHGDVMPEWSSMTPPPEPGEWRWEGTKQGLEMSGTWTKLPTKYPLVPGMVIEDPNAIYMISKVLPHDVRLRFFQKGGEATQIVTVPRSLIEETVRLWPPRFIPGVTPVEVQPTPEG